MKFTVIILLVQFTLIPSVYGSTIYDSLYGHWKGVKMIQDEQSYDGKTYFLPNEGEMILDHECINLYYYPFFKSAKFDVSYTSDALFYEIGDKKIQCNYHFLNDTLVFEMAYINKIFIKLFTRTKLDEAVIDDLDNFGFRTEKLIHEFELDTFHKEQRKGFGSFDSIGFIPYNYLEFKPDNILIINRKDKVIYSRSFKKITFSYNGFMQEMEVAHIGGTQDIHLKQISLCQCDSITVPYITVDWADRIRKAIKDEEEF